MYTEEQEIQMPGIYEQNNCLVENMLQGSYDNVHVPSCYLDDYLVPPSPATTFQAQTAMVEQDNDFLVSYGYDSNTGMLPSNSWIPNPKSG